MKSIEANKQLIAACCNYCCCILSPCNRHNVQYPGQCTNFTVKKMKEIIQRKQQEHTLLKCG